MGSFTFCQEDALALSLSVNACYLLRMAACRVVAWLVPCLGRRSSRGRTLLALHQRWPGLLGRILMEQISLLILLVLILINLGCVSSSILPFQEHQAGHFHRLTRTILAASAARFFVIALGLVLVSDVTSGGGDDDRSTPSGRGGEMGSRVWHLVYCSIGMASNLIGLGSRQNLLLVGTASFMELSTTSLVICRLIKLADRHKGCRSYLKTAILCCAMCLFSRVLLPILFLCLALTQETPFVMDALPLAWFFASGIFYSVFHSILVYHSFQRVSKASKLSSEPRTHDTPQACALNGPFSILDYPDRLINDIFDETLLETENDLASESCEKKMTTKLKDLNYGFLRCYDNRNLCSFVSKTEEEKINFLQKKNCSKHEFIHKFFTRESFPNIYSSPSGNKHCRSEEPRGLVMEGKIAERHFVPNDSPCDTGHVDPLASQDKIILQSCGRSTQDVLTESNESFLNQLNPPKSDSESSHSLNGVLNCLDEAGYDGTQSKALTGHSSRPECNNGPEMMSSDPDHSVVGEGKDNSDPPVAECCPLDSSVVSPAYMRDYLCRSPVSINEFSMLIEDPEPSHFGNVPECSVGRDHSNATSTPCYETHDSSPKMVLMDVENSLDKTCDGPSGEAPTGDTVLLPW